jgi:AhpD family alkylhydroperoxidase
MARIDYADLGEPAPALQPLLEKISKGRPFVPNLYRMLLRSPVVADGWVSMANAVRFESKLDDHSRELAILLVSEITGCEYEWHHHARLAETAGISPEELERIRAWPDLDAWSPEDRSLLRAVGAMAERERLPESDLVERLGEETFLELAATVAYYVGLAHFLLAMEIEVEAE